jgi:hypothetical protein
MIQNKTLIFLPPDQIPNLLPIFSSIAGPNYYLKMPKVCVFGRNFYLNAKNVPVPNIHRHSTPKFQNQITPSSSKFIKFHQLTISNQLRQTLTNTYIIDPSKHPCKFQKLDGARLFVVPNL